ncbi:CMP-N-acetylneuraminate-beta-galactosamide-alpha-2,3-sialyltransferase 1-like [Neoarius graeffei]|uniref:CMP-N-acetylneuraminate-beta-galactosamide- alpha-2,3-sialyltransferase 1-like n=1 Tax=Neoarius graeffei TaxID=443677 RepID=UPI00298C5BE3|nr:CMP-N-acetylneuraminate-beta-galactosamide-alpha-2,3-sialyltransferase 1-like [Neoarius graeffei]
MIYLTSRKLKALMLIFCLVSFAMVLLRAPSFLLSPFQNIINGPCGCRPCIWDPEEEDPWFSERFNQSIQPLLSRLNSELSDDTYRWWLWLQAEDNPSELSAVMDRLFQVVPGEQRYTDAGPSRCRSCSVVGNSGNLLSSYYGKLIDSSNFVIRINQAPTQGFEHDVGSRTTHHVMYPESAIDLQNSSTIMLLIPFKILDLEWLVSSLTSGHINHTYMPVRSRISANRHNVLVYNPLFMKYVHEVWLESHGRYPSTGFLSIIFALHICDQVNVFGFGADQEGNWHHYWEENQMSGAFKETGVHNADYEYNITQLLAQKGKIRMFKGV